MLVELNKAIEGLDKKFEYSGNKFEPFIRHIRFPKYKGIKTNERVDFEFPITIFVGENGCNKTSILQALYGAPEGKSVGEYWFETEVDKISDDSGLRSCFIYGYKNYRAKKTVEVFKSRIQKKGNPEYWEPGRPQKRFEMIAPTQDEVDSDYNKSSTRWDTLKKNVIYCDCKEYVSAYDLFFYHYDFSSSKKFRTRQDFIRNRSKSLSKVINENRQSYEYYGKNRIKDITIVEPKICQIISDIMNVDYSEIKIVTHQLYAKSAFKPSKTIWMKKGDKNYSEAFAGTGEARIILLINDLFNAPEKSLILIDEPEISLHPAAINNLKRYILDTAIKKKHQIVITTHSPKFTEGFPAKAIKLMKSEKDGINIYGNIDSREAFSKLGESSGSCKSLFVEDQLMVHVVNRVIDLKKTKFIKDNLVISPSLGGADNIKKRIEAASYQEQYDCYYLLDGDQKINLNETDDSIIKREWLLDESYKLDVERIPAVDNEKLSDIIKVITGGNIKFYVSSHGNDKNNKELYKVQRRFIKFWNTNVFFLSELTPELALKKIDNIDETIQATDLTGKNYFKEKAISQYGTEEITSIEILHVQRQVLGKLLQSDDLYKDIDSVLSNIFYNK